MDARVIIWIATDFTEEHTKAFDWLNDYTSDELGFYAVQIELWRIDESRPAISEVASQPSAIVRQAAISKALGKITETKKLQLEFWTEFSRRLAAKKVVPSVRAPRPQYWYDIPLGRSGIKLSLTANTWDNKVGIRVYLSNKVADLALPQLEAQQDQIEREIGHPLQWDPNPENRDKVIALTHDADMKNRDQWPEYIDWLMGMTKRFRSTFVQRVKDLDLSGDPKS